MRVRTGLSLVEMLVAVTLSSVVLTIVAMLLHLMLRTDRIARADAQELATINRLAEQFRRDGHLATQITVAGQDDVQRWTFDLGDAQKVVYEMQTEAVFRIQSNGKGRQASETYSLPAGYKISIEPPTPSSPRIARLRIAAPNLPDCSGTPWRLTVEAAIHQAKEHSFEEDKQEPSE